MKFNLKRWEAEWQRKLLKWYPKIYGPKYVALRRAHYAVAKAKKYGRLAKLPDGTPCVDCGGVAYQYDHREYAKPLEVEPVCRSCNKRRGPALEFALRDIRPDIWGKQ